jgi:hypothetical protein
LLLPDTPWEWGLLLAFGVAYVIWLFFSLRAIVPRALDLFARGSLKSLEASVKLTPRHSLAVALQIEASCEIAAVSVALQVANFVGRADEQRPPKDDVRLKQQLDRRVGATKFDGEFELDAFNPARDGWSYSNDFFVNINWVVLITVRLRARPQYHHRIVITVEPDVIVAAQDGGPDRAR